MEIKDIMNKKSMMLDYSDRKIPVTFRIVSVDKVKEMFKGWERINDVEFDECGFTANIPVQLIPDIIKYLSENLIAIYAVIPQYTED